MHIVSESQWRGLIRLYEEGVRRRNSFKYWGELNQSQWADHSEIERLRAIRLASLLDHTVRTSSWHRSRWQKAGIEHLEIQSSTNITRFPVMTRDDIINNLDSIASSAPPHRVLSKTTGGSTGIPLRFYYDTESQDRRLAAWHRGYDWAGAAPGTRQWYLWGIQSAGTSRLSGIKHSLYQWLYRRSVSNSFMLSAGKAKHLSGKLLRLRPEIIVAYAGALDAFARMLEEQKLPAWSPRSIVVGAERLHDFQRDRIERVFSAPVFETYGSREFMLMAAECETRAGLHLTAENHILEILDDNNQPVMPGQEGNVAVTDLTNFAMPFIRYLNGDRGIMMASACACGRSLPRLSRITGRRLDILTTPDGRALPGEFFPHILKDYPAVRRFQVEQVATDHLTLRLVAPKWTASDAERLHREIQAATGAPLDVRIELVDDIPLTEAGKLMVVVNRLGNQSRTGDS